jgi:hypothetical protein
LLHGLARGAQHLAHDPGDNGAAMQIDQGGNRRDRKQAVDGREQGEWIHDFTRTGQKRRRRDCSQFAGRLTRVMRDASAARDNSTNWRAARNRALEEKA